MDYDNFYKLVISRQACRDFNDKKVEPEKAAKICKLARFAPSACNSQPSKMYCITSDSAVKAVAQTLQKDGRNKFVSKASAFIVVSEKEITLMKDVNAVYGADYFVKYDVGETVAYITLAAKSLGIESCIIGWVDGDKLKEILAFEKNEKCSIVVALGYSDAPLRQKIRKSENEVIEFV